MFLNESYINSFLKVTERGAYGAHLFKGKGDKIAADKAAVDEMRKQLNLIDMNGRIVIGEGEMDEAPMLYIGEELGTKKGEHLDIAIDPLEGTNFTAKNLPNALSVLAVSGKGNILHAPDTYMEKIAIGANLPKNLIDLDFGIEKNIKLISEAKNITPEKLTACLLKRDRHSKIIETLNSMKVKIKFIDDGDVNGVLSVAYPHLNVDLYIGTGGAPEGVLAAAALDCLGCQMHTRLVLQNDHEINKAKKCGIKDFNKKYYISDMIKDDVLFCATGVTDGDFTKGIKEKDNYFKAETLVLHKSTKTNKIVKNQVKK